MLLPRFSIKLILVLTAFCAVVAYVGSHAAQHKAWALAIIAGIGLLSCTAIVHACLFLASWLLSSLLGMSRSPASPTSPFAGANPPPQIIEPLNPDTL